MQARDEAGLALSEHATSHAHPDAAQQIYQSYLRGDIRYTLTQDDYDALNTFFYHSFYRTVVPDIPTIKLLPDGEPPALPQPGAERKRAAEDAAEKGSAPGSESTRPASGRGSDA